MCKYIIYAATSENFPAERDGQFDNGDGERDHQTVQSVKIAGFFKKCDEQQCIYIYIYDTHM